MAGVDIATVNALSAEDFVATFGGVLEDSPRLAAAVATGRPFADATALAEAFVAQIDALDDDAAVALVRAHPELGARKPMAVASVHEQAAAGLPDADAALQLRLAEGNAAYRARFGFPFVVAVRGRTPAEIVDLLDARQGHDPDLELATALAEIGAIARLRIEQLVDAL